MTQPPADATVLALDLGGTQVRAALVRADGTRLGRAAAPTPVSDGPAAVVAACIATLQRARENATKEDAAAVSRLVGIGISAPGPLNPWTGVAVEPANLGPRFPGTDLAGPIGAALGLPVFLEHDTKVAILGAGYKDGWGVGRHIYGSNYFHYIRDPWMGLNELFWDIDFIPENAEWEVEKAEANEESLFQWATSPPPEDFLKNYEAVAA